MYRNAKMLEWVLNSPLSACYNFTLVYQWNGQPLSWSDLGGPPHEARDRKLRPNRVFKALSSELKVQTSETPRNAKRFESGIQTEQQIDIIREGHVRHRGVMSSEGDTSNTAGWCHHRGTHQTPRGDVIREGHVHSSNGTTEEVGSMNILTVPASI